MGASRSTSSCRTTRGKRTVGFGCTAILNTRREDRKLTRPALLRILRNRIPPPAPPVGANRDAQLGIPAVCEIGVPLEVVTAVLTLFRAGRLALERGVHREVAQ